MSRNGLFNNLVKIPCFYNDISLNYNNKCKIEYNSKQFLGKYLRFFHLFGKLQGKLKNNILSASIRSER